MLDEPFNGKQDLFIYLFISMVGNALVKHLPIDLCCPKLKIKKLGEKIKNTFQEVGAHAICPFLTLLDFGASLSLVMLLCWSQLPLAIVLFTKCTTDLLLDHLFVSHWPLAPGIPTPWFNKAGGSHSATSWLHERYEDHEAERRGVSKEIFKRTPKWYGRLWGTAVTFCPVYNNHNNHTKICKIRPFFFFFETILFSWGQVGVKV